MGIPGIPSSRRVLRRRSGLSVATAAVLGTDVAMAVPLQRLHPALVLALSIGELLALLALIVTANILALLALAVVAGALVMAAALNRRRVLAITSAGTVLVAASARGRPLTAVGQPPPGLALPRPSGLAVPIRLGGDTWWVERAAFARLEQARRLLEGGQ